MSSMPGKLAAQTNSQTTDYIRRLESLIEASKILNTTLDLGKLLALILDLTTKNLNAERGTIYLIDERKNELWSKVLKGPELVEIRLPVGTGIAGYVAESGKTVMIKDAAKDKRFYSGIDEKSGFRTKTMLCMPMRNRQRKIIGVFQVINKKIGEFTNEDKLFLEAFSDHAALAIENARLHQAALESERIEKEIQIAAKIQQRLLPEILPPIEHYEFSASAIPCKTIGGDFYDIIPLDEHRYALVMADVSGKGIPAALLVSTLHASLRAYIQSHVDLATLTQKLNLLVYENTTSDRFITFFIAMLDNAAHTITFVNAGHNFPLLFHREPFSIEELMASGLPLGMMPDSTYSAQASAFHSKDLLVLYTDGVTEAMNESSNQYGEDRFRKHIETFSDFPVSVLKDRIIEDVHKFVGTVPPSDDLTLLLAKRL